MKYTIFSVINQVRCERVHCPHVPGRPSLSDCSNDEAAAKRAQIHVKTGRNRFVFVFVEAELPDS